PDVIQAAGEANIEGLSFVEANLKKPNFLAALKAEFVPGEEREASAATYSCYSGLVYILRALEKLAAPISSASLVQELSRASELQLMDEKLAIIDREIQFDVSIKKIKAGLVVQE
ncbi:MAG: hypothetical protein DCC75_05575, partial [Proteobacteria bacterium]